MKPSVLNSEPNIFTDQLDRQISILMPKIKLGVSVILLHCTSHLNYPTFKNITWYSHRLLEYNVDGLGVKELKL